MTLPLSNAGELDHGQEARAEFVVVFCYSSEILAFVEEPLNQVALLVLPWREADRLFAVRLFDSFFCSDI